MTTFLWVLQATLSIMFLMVGTTKLLTPYEELIQGKMHGMADFTPFTVKMIGFVELLGAIGLILPMGTGILPWLTPLAAFGIALTMIGAGLFHLRRSEYSSILINAVLMVMALFVVYGLLVLEPVVG